MGGSNELVECFCGGAVAEGYSGAVARLVGDGVEVGLVAGDEGSHVSVRIAPSGRPWIRRVSASQTWSALRPRGRATCDQGAGGALDQGRARTGPIFSDDEVSFPVARDHPVGNVGALQSINRMATMSGLRPPAAGFLRIHHLEGRQMPCSISVLLGWGVNPRVDSLVADRVALGVGRIVHRSHCATCLHAQVCADLAGRAPLRQISNHAAAKGLIAVQEPLPWGGAWQPAPLCRCPGPCTRCQDLGGGRSHGTPPRG